MKSETPTSVPEMIWVNISFFLGTALVAFIGGSIYIAQHGIQSALIWLTAFYLVATGMSITVGYHRLFSHATFKAHPIIDFLMLFFGAAAFQQSALDWSSQHRDHHRYVDTDMDPYSIKKGFFYAHMGWMMFWKHVIHYENSHDLQKNSLLMHQHKHYHAWAIFSGIIFPVILGACFGFAGGAFIFAVCARIVIVYQSTFCINSVCHMFGKATYDIYSTAKDHWLVALITNGEGYHNFHHRFPSDYRNGVRWYQWDPSKWFIAALSFVGLARDLKTVSKFRILEARLKADQQRVRDWISERNEASKWAHLSTELETRYKVLFEKLMAWEKSSKDHGDLICGKIREQSQAIIHLTQKKMEVAKRRFMQERERWMTIVKSNAHLAASLQ